MLCSSDDQLLPSVEEGRRLVRDLPSARRPALRVLANAIAAGHAPLLDPAAGDGEYSGHLPDGLGRLPALRCVKELGWHAAFAEPDPAAFASLAANAATPFSCWS